MSSILCPYYNAPREQGRPVRTNPKYIENRRGHNLSRADVVGILIAEYEQDLENTCSGPVR